MSTTTTSPNAAPVLVAQTADVSWASGTSGRFAVAPKTFVDPKSTALTYAATSADGTALPSWLSFDAATQTFTGFPQMMTGGNQPALSASVKLTATDAAGLSASETFKVGYAAAPVPALANQTPTQAWAIGQQVSFTLAANTFTDPKGGQLSYVLEGPGATPVPMPSWLSFDAATGTFTGTVPNDATSGQLTVSATANGEGLASETFSYVIGDAPVLVAQTADVSWASGTSGRFAVAPKTFVDPKSTALTYAATSADGTALPSWLSFDAATQTFTGFPQMMTGGNQPALSASVKLTATDAAGLSASETFKVGYAAAPVPALANQTPTQTWKLGQQVSFTLAANTFTDPKGGQLSYVLEGPGATPVPMPSWLSFDAATRTFTGTVPNDATSGQLTVSATANGEGLASETFGYNVVAAAPVANVKTAAQTWTNGKAASLSLSAATFADPQGEKLTYAATQANGNALPSWLKFNAATATFSGTPTAGAVGGQVTVKATNTSGLTVAETFMIKALAPATPVLSHKTAQQNVTAGKAVNIALAANTFADPQGEKLTYAATQANGNALPSWLKFNAATDTFSGTAPVKGTILAVKVTAVDAGGAFVSESFNIDVVGTAHAFAQDIASTGQSSAASTAALSAAHGAQTVALASPVAHS